MHYPQFFNQIQTIKLKDNLSNFLGTFEDGIVEFSYLDVAKSAGHSCPTVAGAYIMTSVALENLYPNEIPKRGEIKVSFAEDGISGVSGVIANVITQITGATQNNGFKGLNGKFSRVDLMEFNANITSNAKFQRIDTGAFIEVAYNPNSVAPEPMMSEIMQKIMQGVASNDEIKLFGTLWQKRVKNIFTNIDKVIQIK